MAFDGQGNLWVTDNYTKKLYKLDQTGTLLASYPAGTVDQFRGLEYHPARNRIYLAIMTGPSGSQLKLFEVDPSTGSMTAKVTWGTEFEANRVGIGPDGNIYVTRYSLGTDAVRVYNPSTFALVRAIPPPSGHQRNHQDIAFVGDKFYLSGGSTGSWIDEYRVSDGAFLRTAWSSSGGGSGIARASDSSLYVVGPGGAIIEIEIATGKTLRTLSQGSLSGAGNSSVEVAP
jgi:WD40 repeat protein